MTTRAAMVAEAKSWLGTPYHFRAMVKGPRGGCDCGTFVFGVLKELGLVQGDEAHRAAADWFQHTTEERYLWRMMHHARKVLEAISYHTLEAHPGDVVLTRSPNSRVYNHAGIVTEWPRLIHSVEPSVREDDATRHELWNFREVAVFDVIGRAAAC